MLQKQATAEKTVARDLDVKRKERDGDDIAGGGWRRRALFGCGLVDIQFVSNPSVVLLSSRLLEATSHDGVEELAASTSVFLYIT